MKLLLDTHVFIWLDTAPEKISPTALAACMDAGNTLCLSVASVWEMLIKQRLGKLNLDIPLEEMLKVQQDVNQLQVLPIDLKHVLAV
jgi:PIN domain nuclease of toxin-antitoxin system